MSIESCMTCIITKYGQMATWTNGYMDKWLHAQMTTCTNGYMDK